MLYYTIRYNTILYNTILSYPILYYSIRYSTWLTPTLSKLKGADHSLSSSCATTLRLNSNLGRGEMGERWKLVRVTKWVREWVGEGVGYEDGRGWERESERDTCQT